MSVAFWGFVAGYAVCRAIDYAFDRAWGRVGGCVIAACLMVGFIAMELRP